MTETDSLNVVIIDDDDDIRELLCTMLELNGYQVHSAADGEAGLLLAREVQPICVLLDFGLPGMNGAQVAKGLRKNNPELVIIAITGNIDEAEEDLEVAGVDFVLAKPFSQESILRFLPRVTATDV